MTFDDKAAITGRWHGETLCLKKRPTGGEKAGVMGYSAFGVIVNKLEPVTIYLRGEDHADDFKETKQYANIDEMLADGWIVD